MNKIIIEGTADLHYEDSGMAAILEVSDSGFNKDVFARIQSYHEAPASLSNDEVKAMHTHLNPLAGNLVRVTVEILEVLDD